MKNWKTHELRLLNYWFGEIDNSTLLESGVEPFATQIQRWCAKDEAIDREIRSQFESLYREVAGSVEGWRAVATEVRDSPSGSLALAVLLDQIPRNMYRDTPQMYSHDTLALGHAYRAIEAGHAEDLTLPGRMFLYLPLMHAEDLTVQHICVDLFQELLQSSLKLSPQCSDFYENTLSSAERHRSVVERFGRFPHRNRILGRMNTEQEQKALDDEEDNISF